MGKEEHTIRFLDDSGVVAWEILFTPDTGYVHITDVNGKDDIIIPVTMLERMMEIVNNIRHV